MTVCRSDLDAKKSEYLRKLAGHLRDRARTVAGPRICGQLLFMADYYEDVAAVIGRTIL